MLFNTEQATYSYDNSNANEETLQRHFEKGFAKYAQHHNSLDASLNNGPQTFHLKDEMQAINKESQVTYQDLPKHPITPQSNNDVDYANNYHHYYNYSSNHTNNTSARNMKNTKDIHNTKDTKKINNKETTHRIGYSYSKKDRLKKDLNDTARFNTYFNTSRQKAITYLGKHPYLSFGLHICSGKYLNIMGKNVDKLAIFDNRYGKEIDDKDIKNRVSSHISSINRKINNLNIHKKDRSALKIERKNDKKDIAKIKHSAKKRVDKNPFHKFLANDSTFRNDNMHKVKHKQFKPNVNNNTKNHIRYFGRAL